MSKQKISGIVNLSLMICLFLISLVILSQSTGYNTSLDPVLDFVGDPEIDFVSLLGGSSSDNSYSMVVDDLLNVYIAGWTESSDFTTTSNAYNQTESGLAKDLYIAKISADGSTLIYSTFICGTIDQFSHGSLPALAVDKSGNAILAASTNGNSMETTAGAINSSSMGGRDIIIAKISADGSELLYGTYFGGSDEDFVIDIELDEEDNIYLSGQTESTDFLTTSGAYSESHSGPSPGGIDVFYIKIFANGSLASSTLFGGSGNDSYAFLELDSQGNVILSGGTTSSDMYTTVDALYPSPIGGDGYVFGSYVEGKDDFIVKLSNDGSQVLYSTYIGGNKNEYINALILDSEDNIYIGGSTSSSDFPVSANAFKQTNGHIPDNWIGDIFITKVSADGSEILASTYFDGWAGTRFCRALGLDQDNNIYVTGAGNLHLNVLTANMSNLLYSNEDIGGYSINVAQTQDDSVSIYLAGHLSPSGSPFTGSHVNWLSPTQSQALFVAKYDWALEPDTTTPPTTDEPPTTTTSTPTTAPTTAGSTGGFDFLILEALILMYGVFHFNQRRKKQ
ncbi:MAG: SBBP repeat-containing protein [Candidatus Hodarchaeales archaeon]